MLDVSSNKDASDLDSIARNAIAAAVEVAQLHGVKVGTPKLLKDGSNAMIHLQPAPVVARVSTTSSLLRQPAEKWLQRDLDIASWLHAQGAAVVPPTGELPPGPHISSAKTGRLAMTFWTYVDHDREMPPTDEEAAMALPALHCALEKFPGHLPYLGIVLEELPHWLHWLEQNHAHSAADLIALRQAHWGVAQTLQKNRSRLRPLHGDAHRGNLLRTPQGLLWTDFEDACTGPVAWDVAMLLAHDPANAESTLTAYPDAPSWAEILPFLEARELVAVIYRQVLGRRFPDRQQEAIDALAAWHRKFSF